MNPRPAVQSEETLKQLVGSALDAYAKTINGAPTTNGELPHLTKDQVRTRHKAQRSDLAGRESKALKTVARDLVSSFFATGAEVSPSEIAPKLILAESGKETGNLFRLATSLWSVPVSRGYGRRMRFLVVDTHNDKLIGIFALGDPVFNLRARDGWIGWTVRDREQRLAFVMDAYVIGAVPPYSQLLGGKLCASLIGSREVSELFDSRYGSTTGLISAARKSARLALVTTSSSLGRSSLYNRLRLPGLVAFERLGATQGWGHFQVPADLFEQMRQLLELQGHGYAKGYKYGDGPNWRMRVIRQATVAVGRDPSLLRHGVVREVYGAPLATNWKEFLKGEENECIVERPSVAEISAAARKRWLVPRAERRPEFIQWSARHRGALFRNITKAN
jgi:hypothetical protein